MTERELRERGGERDLIERRGGIEKDRKQYKESMNSYFANPSLSCHIAGGQDVLPNVALNSNTYDPVRHFSSYGAAVAQSRIYSSSFYSPQDNVVFGSSRPYEYGSNVFYQDKDVLPNCRQTSLGLGAQSSLAQDYPSEQGRNGSQAQQ